jgi:zinc transport system permease protein
MLDFLNAAIENNFLLYALLAALLSSISCGIIGTYMVSKKLTFLTGGISHSVLGGMGLIYYLNFIYSLDINPIYGAIVFAILAAIIIGIISLKKEYDTDTIIASIWALGMGIGIIFIALTPAYNQSLTTYLFGNILMVSKLDLYIISTLNFIILSLSILFYSKFLYIIFDEEFAKLKGINVSFYYLLMLILISLTIVSLIQVVGLILIIALLAIPPSIAKKYVKTIKQMMILSILLGAFFSFIGLYISYELNIPSGASIVLSASVFFLISILIKKR